MVYFCYVLFITTFPFLCHLYTPQPFVHGSFDILIQKYSSSVSCKCMLFVLCPSVNHTVGCIRSLHVLLKVLVLTVCWPFNLHLPRTCRFTYLGLQIRCVLGLVNDVTADLDLFILLLDALLHCFVTTCVHCFRLPHYILHAVPKCNWSCVS